MAISLRDRSSEVLERLMGGPIGQKIAADIASEALAKRKSAVVEVGRLQSVLDREIPRFAGMMAGAALDVMKAESALAEAKSRQLALHSDRAIVVKGTELAQNVQRRFLCELAPDSIRRFKSEILERSENMQYSGPIASDGQANVSIWKDEALAARDAAKRTGARMSRVARRSTRPSVRARVAAPSIPR